jgi:phytoene dehydrogenase-like protein
LGKSYGVTYQTDSPVERILVKGGAATGVQIPNNKELFADLVISDADVHHTETALLDKKHRDHSERYWRGRTMAPSALLMYLGVDKQYKSLLHHNLLFSNDWQKNFAQLFDKPVLPDDPSLYVCAPSKTDPSVAPKGKDNLFVLVPLASGRAGIICRCHPTDRRNRDETARTPQTYRIPKAVRFAGFCYAFQ